METIDVPFYDQVETYTNCTVQILKNSQTGAISIGWWPNETEDYLEMED